MRPFDGKRVLLGVTGGIASYKSAWLARLLTKAGAEVDVVLTRSATEFIGPITFEALTGRPVHTHLIAAGHALDHIKLARSADAIIVAPATADFMARAATGQADDLLTAILLAAPCRPERSEGPGTGATRGTPVLLVPAMNDRMWAHPQVQANVAHLRTLGYQALDPDEGDLAAGEGAGPGRMPEPETIFAHAGRLLQTHSLAGRSVVVSAGPTQEPVDPVRYLTNHSSGRMGVEIAAAAWRRGAAVTLIAGPLSVPLPPGVPVLRVQTTIEMRDAVANALPQADALVMAAAPADFTPASPASQKIKKGSEGSMTLALAETPDILRSTIEARKPGSVIVGFALETNDTLGHARGKLKAKELDLVVANDATEPGAGFGVETNRVTLVARDGGEEPLPLMSKAEVAEVILDRVEELLR